MKKIYLFALLAAASINLMAQSEGSANGVKYSYISTAATIIGTTEDFNTADFAIPYDFGGHPVTAIAEAAFAGNTVLKSVDFSKATALTSIGNRAFQNTKITSVVLPQNNLTIGENAFEACPITTLRLTGENIKIGKQAFNYCTSLERMVDFGKGTTVGEQAFRYCENLNLLVFDQSGILFESHAFEAIGGGNQIDIFIRNYLPQFNASAVFVDDTNKKLSVKAYVACDLKSGYLGSYDWPQVAATPIDELPEHEDLGFVLPASFEGGSLDLTQPTCDEYPEYFYSLKAVADEVAEYTFKEWKDGNKDNPRKIAMLSTGGIYNVDEYTPVFVKNATALETVGAQAQKARKVVVDGQLLIIRGGKTYNALGAEIQR